ncbi:MAG: efflux RND transporter periplasmic adaptor subunit [Rhodomicrobium sp.]
MTQYPLYGSSTLASVCVKGNKAKSFRFIALLPSLLLMQETVAAGSELIPVRTVVAETSKFTREVRLTGTIQARVQTSLSFRIAGKISSRAAEVGDHVTADQVLATLDARDQNADLDGAKAAVSSAEAVLVQAKANFERQKALLAQGFTPQANYDQARASFESASAQVDAAKASLKSAEEQLSYTKLRAGVDGTIVGRDAEAGEVVQPGKQIFALAQDGPRDAIFDVYEALLRSRPANVQVEITLQANPKVRTTASIREVSPTIDSKSGTVRVKLGLAWTPPEMTLGAAVVGRARLDGDEAIVLPWSALYEWQGGPAVWIVGEGNRVYPKPVSIEAFATKELVLSGGVTPGEKVVTAGVQFLRPGQEVTVATGGSQ